MNTDRLVASLKDFAELYPDMRIGQLIEMAALLSSEDVPVDVGEVEDDRLRDAVEDHVRERRCRLGGEAGAAVGQGGMRAELLDALGQAYSDRGERRFGPFVERLATVAGSTLYDVEDENLGAAARGLAVGTR